MGSDPTGHWDWGKFFSGASLLVTGLTAVATAATILTCGAAAPLMVAVAAATATAGTLTVANGAAEMIESGTGFNFVRDGVMGGNTKAYEAYRDTMSTISEIGTMICGSYYAAKGGNVCFVAGTLVKTADGNRPIEEIAAGDYVWAWDEATGDVALKEVIETYVNETSELIHLFVNGEEIITTPTHPYYSPVKGWTDAVNLRAGDILVLVNGEYVVVEKVQHEILESPVTVYNFNVSDYHTYYVASTGVLVHNKCTITDDALENLSTGRTTPNNLTEKLAMEAAKSNPTAGKVILPTLNDPRLAGFSKFAQNFKTSIGNIEIHYVGSIDFNIFFDFKFK